MVNNDNEKQSFKKSEAFNYERCDQELLENSANDWRDINQPKREKNKMCNSYYGLIAVKDDINRP